MNSGRVADVTSKGLLAVFLIAAATTHAESGFRITISATNSAGVVIQWTAQSPIPAGGWQLFPQYRLERSEDLATWEALSAELPSSTGQVFRIIDQAQPAAKSFYRVRSAIEQPFGDLNGAQLAGGDLTGANFYGAKLFAANLSQAVLNHADLSGADLRFSVLVGADLRFASFSQTKLDANTLIADKWRLVWYLKNNGTTGRVLANADLSFATMQNVNFNGTDLSGADLTETDISGSDLRNANLSRANLRWVDFRRT